MNKWMVAVFAAFAACMWLSLGLFFAFPCASFLAGYLIGLAGMVAAFIIDWAASTTGTASSGA